MYYNGHNTYSMGMVLEDVLAMLFLQDDDWPRASVNLCKL